MSAKGGTESAVPATGTSSDEKTQGQAAGEVVAPADSGEKAIEQEVHSADTSAIHSTSSESEPALPDSPGKDTSLDRSGVALLTPKKKQSPSSAPSSSEQSGSQKTDKGKVSRLRTKISKSKSNPRVQTARMATSLEDITSLRLWKGIIAEFVGTLLLTLVGCGSCVDLNPLPDDYKGLGKSIPVVQIALCFGLSVATIVWAIAHVSGGHINPAVTAAMLATRKISLVKAVFFILFQLIGAVVGAGILYGLTPDGYHGMMGTTALSSKVSPGQGVGVEILITFVLVFTVFASCDGKRTDMKGSAPLTIGLSVTMCHLFAIQFTGSSMNTARSFGPAVVMGNWEDHWVYWVGPILGGVAAGILYDNLFAVNASLSKAKACILSSDYDDDKYRASKIKVRIIEEDDAVDEDAEELALSEKKDPSEA